MAKPVLALVVFFFVLAMSYLASTSDAKSIAVGLR
jgi:hypothetical protein